MNKRLDLIKNLPIFYLNSLRAQSKKDILPFLKYQKKKGRISGLKKGVYASKDFIDKEKLKGNFEAYLEFIANKLIEPSYLSSEYVLSKYSIISESVYGLTSITLKTPRKINNQLGRFYYFKIKSDLFCGFEIVNKKNYLIKQAKKSKALFDFLYFKKRGLVKIDMRFIKELRLNLDEVSKEEWFEFEEYVELSKSKKMRKISELLKLC